MRTYFNQDPPRRLLRQKAEGMIVKNKHGVSVDWDVAVTRMDDDVRDTLYIEIGPCTEQEFFTAYEVAHILATGKEWELSKEMPEDIMRGMKGGRNMLYVNEGKPDARTMTNHEAAMAINEATTWDECEDIVDAIIDAYFSEMREESEPDWEPVILQWVDDVLEKGEQE